MGKVISFRRRDVLRVSEHAETSTARLVCVRRDLARLQDDVEAALAGQRVVNGFLEQLYGPLDAA